MAVRCVSQFSTLVRARDVEARSSLMTWGGVGVATSLEVSQNQVRTDRHGVTRAGAGEGEAPVMKRSRRRVPLQDSRRREVATSFM